MSYGALSILTSVRFHDASVGSAMQRMLSPLGLSVVVIEKEKQILGRKVNGNFLEVPLHQILAAIESQANIRILKRPGEIVIKELIETENPHIFAGVDHEKKIS